MRGLFCVPVLPDGHFFLHQLGRGGYTRRPMSERSSTIAFWFRYGPAVQARQFLGMPMLWKRLAAKGVRIHYTSMRPAREDREEADRLLADAAAVAHYLPFRASMSGFWKGVQLLVWVALVPFFALAARFRGVDAVFIDETLPLTAFWARVFLPRRTKLAVSVVDMFLDEYGRGIWRPVARMVQALDLWAWRRADILFIRTAAAADWLAARGVRRERLRKVYDPCDFEVYTAALPADEREAVRAKYGFGKDDFVLVHHGILHTYKGNDFLLRGLAELRARPDGAGWKFLLVGSGPEEARLRRMVGKLGLEGAVTFAPYMPLAELNRAIHAGDVAVAMRRPGGLSASFGVTSTLMHNMACAMPILAASIPGMLEVVADRENALLFDPADVASFVEAAVVLRGVTVLRLRLAETALADAWRLFDLSMVVGIQLQALLELVKREGKDVDEGEGGTENGDG